MTRTLHISAATDPQTLPRVLGLFSQRWVVPSAFAARVDGDTMEIRCEAPDLGAADLDIVLAKLREMVLVREITLEAGGCAGRPRGVADA